MYEYVLKCLVWLGEAWAWLGQGQV
ncbi:hypothetical protein A2U01_0079528, partial [Trifolium medium]|nr:hypothetical protein [Trifolium medium]